MASLSKAKGRARVKKEDAELDITSFMNLMIVLVPVLLMMMVFSRITVVELNLPSVNGQASGEELEQESLEIEVSERGLDIFYPQGYLVSNIPMITPEGEQSSGKVHDYQQLQKRLIGIKQTLLAKGADKKDIVLLLQDDTDYQTVVSLIDYTRSYEDVLINSVVQAELFPEVSLSDAPKRKGDSK